VRKEVEIGWSPAVSCRIRVSPLGQLLGSGVQKPGLTNSFADIEAAGSSNGSGSDFARTPGWLSPFRYARIVLRSRPV
jgi:hypothetical protein